MASLQPCESGRRGDDVRGDVWLAYAPGNQELAWEFSSKLEALFGATTRQLLAELAANHGLTSGTLQVEDKGAYPFVLRARMESLLQKALADESIQVSPEPPLAPSADGTPQLSSTRKDRLRRSRLYLPGNEAKYMLNAGLHGPDAVILDLEDSVAPASKQDAVALVRHALWTLDFGSCERMVRINQGEAGIKDLQALAGAPLHLVLIPKVESAEEIHALDQVVGETKILFMPILETARGVLNALAIAEASPRNVALTLGLEDLTADLGVVKTPGGAETAWASSQVIYAAKAAGLQAIDSVYGNVADEDGLRRSVKFAKSIGFEGKGGVHPRQIKIIHQEFAPSEEEVAKARAIVAAFEEAQAKGLGVVSLGSKMIDPPVVKRAQALVRLADEMTSAEKND